MKELCIGFPSLTDGEKGVITFEGMDLLGLGDMSDEQLVCMLREGDGGLDDMEFCPLMFRLSPALMNCSTTLLEEALGARRTQEHSSRVVRAVRVALLRGDTCIKGDTCGGVAWDTPDTMEVRPWMRGCPGHPAPWRSAPDQ
ncbi:zinc finger protein CONSTANS-LIKE 3-like [Hibiscus syriacus]|uniref:Zinc finger protein CONSTANS-LIKE 3-like n=1 Tax=Hibiscus syriacus TaxID=106335 RepID=A0A6A3CMW8_HIBSY|nr:zinc finger protein CONSTANS-LIKE 3-like [Hibiscus syriacus]